MNMRGAQIVCKSLLREGCDVVFGIPGGAILPLYQTLPEFPDLRHILVRHEQGAAHAADGYARVTGKPGVAFATSGPGATNLVTGIAAAQMDSVPMVIVTGQVGRPSIGTDAFQETDITGITLPITKHNFLVMEAKDIARVIKEAFFIANSGRPGPVLVDIPRDVFMEEVDYEEPLELDLPGYKPTISGNNRQIKKASALIQSAKRPVILAGHGVIISRAYDELKELAERAQIPVITTLLGISCFPEDHVLWTGWPGMHGMAYSSLALDEADLIVALGMRFDDRITGNAEKFSSKSKKIHVDIDPSEIGKIIPVDVPIVGDVKDVLVKLNELVEPSTHSDWLKRIETLKKDHPSLRLPETDKLLARQVIRDISEITEGNATIVTGVGQHQMWAAQHYEFKNPCSLLTSGGSGTMGYEVPAAMGAQVASPDGTVWSIAGDGGFQMTLCELATIVENKLPVKFAILNNGFLGMVRQWQEIFFESSYVSTGYSGNPDFVKLAEAYGIKGIRVTDKTQVKTAIQDAMEHDGPVLIDFIVEQEENVYPMIPSGMTVKDMIEEPSSERVTV
ncbi:MAG: biosynthetic-type acetolactate synthase large subunit [SAR202 cluster bacterium]|jgi:acetolactate synthase-1/2/3 large subunit|nr:biosynthetic-type acetolactate synthase large subunit [SAR202 cluster bacterium]|tara:strand:+ start:1089 stop:2783 length:1695 start_codon:yes stop_codon:yes gene_type:complete